MTPILYAKDEIDFTSQGLGSLVEIYDVDVEEQRNGLLQLTASYPVSGVRYADISVGRIILAKPNQRDDVHAFRIVSTELDISGYAVTIEADSITYDLTHNLVKHLNVSGNGQAFMTALKNAIVNPSVFTFYSDIATSSTTSLNYVNPMEAIMGTTGSFLQIWGGELKRENRRVAMFNRRGRDNVSTFRLGKNIAGLKYSVDISSLVTRIIPTKSVQNDDQTTTTLEGTPVDSRYINNYEQIYTLPLEFTDDAIKTVADLNAAAKGWFTQSANTGRDKPTVTIDIDVLSLQDSADYQDKFKNLESVSLTDTVTVYVPEYGVNVTAIVNELHYDPILDRVTKMTVGTAKQSFADSSRTQLSDLQDKIISVQNQADAVAMSANGKSTNYYGSVEPSHPQEGDTWFWVNGDKSGIKVFVNGEWVEQVDSDTQEKIANAVTDAVAQAKSHTDEVKQGLSSDIATAKSQATSQANTAEANAKSAATSQFTQAQNALSAAKTDLTKSIASEASARNQAVSAANSQAQTYANQAKADALNTIAKEVSDRQSAVSALDTKATNAVNQAKSDITDTINAISVGGRNYFMTSTAVSGYIGTDGVIVNSSSLGVKTSDYIYVTTGDTWQLTYWPSDTTNRRMLYAMYDSSNNFVGSRVAVDVPTTTDSSTVSVVIPDGVTKIRVGGQYMSDDSSKIKAELGTVATDWTPAPEDVVLDYTTKDNQIKATITQYQETNDGKVTKAQTDATTALGLVATKVSQTDYDKKTGDLSTKYTQVKQTADSQATDIVNIKETATSQASKINSISSDVDGTKQSISDINTEQGKQSSKINQISSDVDGTKQAITDIQTADGKQDTRMGTIETSVSGVKSDFSSYKTTNDGAVKTAQTTAQTAVDGLALKVSKTDYDQKTGDLSTKINDVKETADSSAQTIADIQEADGRRDSRISEVEKTAGEIKSTVSDLSTAQGKQSGDISTLKQRADGFDATVTKVDNLSIGGRNYFQIVNSVVGYINTDGTLNSSSGLGVKTSDYIPVNAGDMWQLTYWSSDTTNRRMLYAMYDSSNNLVGSRMAIDVPSEKDSATASLLIPSGVAKIRVGAQYMADGSSKIKAELGTLGTDWTPAPEDVDSATATAQLTANEASAAVTKLTNADGIITKAQADIKANADAITKTVSKTVYDQNTGDLTRAISKAQSTADGAVSTVGNYQTSNDKRVKAAESTIEQHTKDITARVTQTDYDNNNSNLNTRFTKVEATANGVSTTVANLQTDFNGMSYENRNLLENSGFEFPVNNITGKFSVVDGSNTTRPIPFDTKMGLIDNVDNQVVDDLWGWYPLNTAVTLKANVTYTLSYYFSVAGKAGYQHSDYGIDDSGSPIKGIMAEHEIPDTTGGQMVWKRYSKTFTLKTDTVLAGLRFGFVSNIDGRGWKVVDNVKLEIGSKATDHSVAPKDTTLSISQVSQTADSISNFVRDSSGNISSNFQTALSRTSIITGSTFATSIKKETATQISSALTDNNGKIISLINQDRSGVQIAGKNIVLDGNTTVTGDFYAKGGNFKNLNASNLTVGTLNGTQVNITNINANNIVSGEISGANLNINLNTGSVVFQKGRINSSDYTTDINIDQGYISTANGDTRAILSQGKLQLIDPSWFAPQEIPYLEISNNSGVFNGMAALVKARDSLTVSIDGYDKRMYDTPMYDEQFVGLSIGKSSNELMPTKIGGADQGVVISGGKHYTGGVYSAPYIYVGSGSGGGSPNGDRIYLGGNYVHSPSTYLKTTSGSANVVVNSDGALVRSSSARKYKLDIKNNISIADSLKLIEVPLSTWIDKHEHEENGSNERYFGMIAEDLRDAGLEYLVQYGEDNEVEGINYDRVALLLIPLVKELKERIEELERKGK